MTFPGGKSHGHHVSEDGDEDAETETDTARKVVTEMLAAIEAGGEQAVRDYALASTNGRATSS